MAVIICFLWLTIPFVRLIHDHQHHPDLDREHSEHFVVEKCGVCDYLFDRKNNIFACVEHVPIVVFSLPGKCFFFRKTLRLFGTSTLLSTSRGPPLN